MFDIILPSKIFNFILKMIDYEGYDAFSVEEYIAMYSRPDRVKLHLYKQGIATVFFVDSNGIKLHQYHWNCCILEGETRFPFSNKFGNLK
jgi:hypothetical protein